MSTIGSFSNPYLPTNLPSTTGTPGTGATGTGGTVGGPEGTQAPVGGGTVAQTDAAPGVGNVTVGQLSLVMTAMMESLHEFMPEISGDDQDVILAEVQMKMKETVNKTDNDEVKNKTEARQKQLDEQKKKLEDAEKKLEDQIKLQNSGNIFDKIKLAFEILGAILATIVAAVIAVASFGAAAPVGAVLIAGAVMGLVGAIAGDIMVVNDVTQKETGLGIAGNIDKLIHPNDPDSWAKADQGFMYAIMGAAVLGMIVGMATGSGEAQIAEMSAEISQEIVAKAMFATNVTQVATTVGQVAGDIGSGVVNYQTTEVQAETKKDQARAKEMQALIKHMDEMIELAIKRLQVDGDRFVKMLDSVTSSMQDRANTVGQAKLTA